VILIAHPNGSGVTTYSYSGATVTVNDPAGKWKKLTRDSLGNLVQVSEPNPQGGAELTTMYT
jgi:YD repeat-containing protein